MSNLLNSLYVAHAHSALRGNVSHQALTMAAIGSENFINSIVAALMTLGGKHAPLLATYDVLNDVNFRVHDHSGKVPGWGSDFVRKKPDPAWDDVDAELRKANPELHERIVEITDALHREDKIIFPNPSCYTAAVGITLKIPRETLPVLFIQGRLWRWAEEYNRVREEA